MRDYKLTRSKRKTVAIYVRGSGVEVRAPLKTPAREIERFIESKEKWISRRLNAEAKLAEERERHTLGFGSMIPYRGALYPVESGDGRCVGFDGERFLIPPDADRIRLKAACVNVYRALAKRRLNERTREWAAFMSVTPAAIKITSARTRWGSCSVKKTVNFSWRIIMASDDVIDYVIVHELAHLTEMNHSTRFWKVVADALPDFYERRLRLRKYQLAIAAEDWLTN